MWSSPGRETGSGEVAQSGPWASWSQAPWMLMGPSHRALLPRALEGTDVQTKAAQALAKLTITSNPEMTFPRRAGACLPAPAPACPPLSVGPSWPWTQAVAPLWGPWVGRETSGAGLPSAGPVGVGRARAGSPDAWVVIVDLRRRSAPSSPCCTNCSGLQNFEAPWL